MDDYPAPSLKELADPDCPKCNGTAYVEEGAFGWASCLCVELGKRRWLTKSKLERSLPRRAQTMTLENFQDGGIRVNKKALKVAENFVQNWPKAAEEGWMVGFYGEPGAGKTHLAVGILQAVAYRYNQEVQFLNLPLALREERERIRSDSAESPFSRAQTSPLLVLDDLGAEYQRSGNDGVSWLSEQLYILLEARQMALLPTIFTTNMDFQQMHQRFKNEAWQRVIARIERMSVLPPLEMMPVPGIMSDRTREASSVLLG